MARQKNQLANVQTARRPGEQSMKKGRVMKLPVLKPQAPAGNRAATRPKEKPAWQDPTPKTGGFPPLESATVCTCMDCRRLRPTRLSWPPAANKRQIHRFAMNDSYCLHTSSCTGLYSDLGVEDAAAVREQTLAAARNSLLCSDGPKRPICGEFLLFHSLASRRERTMGAAPRLSQSLHLPAISKPSITAVATRSSPTFRRASNRPTTVPKPVAGERKPQLTTRLPVILSSGRTVQCKDDDPRDWAVGESDDDCAYETESFCSESLSSYCSDSDLEHHGAMDENWEEKEEARRAAELSQLQDYARWAKRFGGGAKGLSVASFLQEWRDSRKVGAVDDARTADVRRMAERLMSGEPMLEEIVAWHIPQQKTKQQEHLEQIERIRRDLIAMRQRRALQQQEAAYRQEQQRGDAFRGLGEHMSAAYEKDGSADPAKDNTC